VALVHLRRWLLPLACALAFCARPAPAHAKRPGTHFLAELDAGASLTGDGGPQASIALGAGGKLKGFAPRFYVLGSFARSAYEASSGAPFDGDEYGSFGDLALGPRVYLPIAGPLRLFVDGQLGASYASATFVERDSGRGPLSADEWLGLGIVSSGLSLRLIRALSIGARVSLAFNEAGLAGAARLAGVRDPVRVSINAGVTWHF
jgi:hypothetical protein